MNVTSTPPLKIHAHGDMVLLLVPLYVNFVQLLTSRSMSHIYIYMTWMPFTLKRLWETWYLYLVYFNVNAPFSEVILYWPRYVGA